MLKYLSLLILAVCTISCGSADHNHDKSDFQQYEIKYAKGFSVKIFDDYKEVTLRDPWDTTKILQKYILIDRNKEIPSELPKGTLLKIPVMNVVANASTHCAVLEELNILNRLSGVCESRYIDIADIKERVQKGELPDLGEATSPDIERLLMILPEAIMTSPFQNVGYGRMGKTGIPILECADYMESTPLARAEWIKLHGIIFGKEQQADSLFNQTEINYNSLKKLIGDIENKPTLFSERKTGATWFTPGGQSYIANLYKDAGAAYLWSDTDKVGSLPLAFEEVFEKAIDADIWLIKYNSSVPLTYDQLKRDVPLYAQFKAWKEKNIYVCNTANVPYYEEMPLHPDRLLKDLAYIFHPELFIDYSPVYFTKMTD